jgi:hypothetical protein
MASFEFPFLERCEVRGNNGVDNGELQIIVSNLESEGAVITNEAVRNFSNLESAMLF